MRKPYTPAPDSLAARMLGYFRANPDEELTIGDVAIKFGAPYTSVPACLQTPIKHGLLCRTKNKPFTYRSGPLMKENSS